MNDAEFEKNLREMLRPAEPSANLQARIRQELQATDAASKAATAGRLVQSSQPGFLYQFLRDFGWACAGAAAVLAVLTLLHGKSVSDATSPKQALATNPSAVAPAQLAALERDETTHELVSSEEPQQLIETDEGPAREVRYSYVERHAWSDPQTGARVVLEVPREDVYLVPVSLQ